MRLLRWRLTIRGLMCVVFVIGIVLHLGIAAFQVYSATESHPHTWLDVQDEIPNMTMTTGIRSPFWPRFWRCLVGVPWKGQPLCPQVEGRLLDYCSLVHPEIVYSDRVGRIGVRAAKEQEALLNQLSNRRR